MSTSRIASFLLLASLVGMIAASMIGPKGIYGTQDLERRVEIIENNKSGWNISQTLIGISILLTAAGFAVLGSNLRAEAGAWTPSLAVGLLGIGSISGLIFIYRQTVDPLSAYQGAFSTFETLCYWLAILSLVLFGIIFLRAGLPAWMGYVTSGVSSVFGIFYLVTGSGFLTPIILFLLSLMIGLYFLRR